MSRRGSPFARIARAAERAEAHALAARPPHLRHLSASDYAAACARAALEALRAERAATERARAGRIAGLSSEALQLIATLRRLHDVATIADARVAFGILAAPDEQFDRGLAELAGAGLIDLGPAMGPMGSRRRRA